MLDWGGQTAVVVATGPSSQQSLECIRDRARLIVIKQWRLAPWADVLYASDGLWWEKHRGAPEFAGLKVTASPRAARLFGLHQVSPVGRGGHSGAHAVHLAMDFGVRRIVLLGFDLALLDADGAMFRNVEIINASPVSALKSFPKMSLAEALGDVAANQDRADQPRHRVDVERNTIAEGKVGGFRGFRWGANRGSERD